MHGKKQQLFTRIAKMEVTLKTQREADEAALALHEARVGAGQVTSNVSIAATKAPTPQERALHELTHTPFTGWCEPCILGQAGEKPHLRTDVMPGSAKPLIQFDFAFTHAAEGE